MSQIKPKYTDKDREKVMDIFLNEEDNRVTTIVKITGFKRGFVNKVIEKYFNNKMENKL